MMIKQKLLDLAIEHQMGMYWECRLSTMNLYVVTAMSENGKQRSRLVASVEKIGEALAISKMIYDKGGNLISEDLTDTDAKWRFGYNPDRDYLALCQVREADLAKQYKHFQPRWEEFRAATKGK